MKRYYYFLFIIILGCQQNSEFKAISSLDFFSEPYSNVNNLNQIAEDIRYVPLQVRGNGIMEIRVTDDKYFIKNFSDEIECLDKNGKFLFKLSKKGNGETEYNSMPDFDVTSDAKLLAVSTWREIKIYEISDTCFVFLKSININNEDIKPTTLRFVPGENLLLFSYFNLGTEPYIDILIDNDGHSIAARPNYHRLKKTLAFNIFLKNTLYKYNNSLFFKEPVNDTVYTVDNSKIIKPNLVFDNHGQNFNQKIVSRIQAGKLDKHLWDYFEIISLMETPRYLIGYIIYKKMELIRIYDKNLGKYFGISNNSLFIKDNIMGGPDFTPRYCDGKMIFDWIHTEDLKSYIENNAFLNSEAPIEKKKWLKSFWESLQNRDTHILVIVKPKE